MRFILPLILACYCFASKAMIAQECVSFDAQSLCPCIEVNPPKQSDTTRKVVLIVVPVSTNFMAEESSVENLHYEFEFPQSMTILDRYPKTQSAIELDDLSDQQKREHLVADLNVSFRKGGEVAFSLFGLGENAFQSDRDFKEIETNVKAFRMPPRGQLIISGTAHEGQTWYFDLKWFNQIPRAGQTDFAFLVEVPKDWRGDTITLTCEASHGKGAGGQLSKVIGVYPMGDSSASQYVEGLIKSVVPAAKESKEIITNSIGTRLTLIPAGAFLRGAIPEDQSASDHEKPQRTVTISKPFYIGVFEVTQYEYRLVMNDYPSNFQESELLPVETVSWLEAVEFCNRLSELESRSPYYKIDGKTVTVLGGNGYRLPSEAEWEYACAAPTNPGEPTIYWFGNDSSNLGEYEWTGELEGNTHPVGTKKPNRWGLYDMHGNVKEWCQDWYSSTYYDLEPEKDPVGPKTGIFRVFRGGCWLNSPYSCRTAHRRFGMLDLRHDSIGFRLALDLSQD